MPGYKFDADTEHPWAKQWRIPRVTTTHPGWKYEVALVVPSLEDPNNFWQATEPTEEEARIIASYIEFHMTYYRKSWAEKMRERAFDVDDSTNTVVLIRLAEGWRYRLASYRGGPLLYPAHDDPDRDQYAPTSAGLIALMDRIGKYRSLWPEWKAAHPEVFGAGQ